MKALIVTTIAASLFAAFIYAGAQPTAADTMQRAVDQRAAILNSL